MATVCGCLLWSGCHNNETIQGLEKSASSKMPPPPQPPSVRPQGDTTGMQFSNKVFRYADKMPSFPGGEKALMQYLHDHIQYPKDARRNGISGTVVVQFTVNKDGSLSDLATIGKHLGGGLEQESIAVVKGMPDWIAGSNKGRKVNVRYSLPIRYELQ